MSQAVKYDEGKTPLALISRPLVEQLALVRHFGAQKYTLHGWKQGMSYTRTLSAALRHIFAFLDGEGEDGESHLSHLAHAVADLEHVLYYEAHKMGGQYDDRYKKA